MGLLSTNLRTALRTRSANLFWVLELGLPGGTKRYGTGDVSVIGQGHYHGKILTAGGVDRDAADRGLELRALELTDEIDDTDFTFGKIVDGSAGNSIVGSTAVRKLGAAGVAYADWLTYFSGIVEQFEFPAPLRYRVRMRTDDRPLRRTFGRVIAQSDWPNSHPEARGQIAPYLYGTHAAAGGAIPCPLVDISGARYLVCVGHLKSVTAVYVGGSAVSSGYTVTYPNVNGRTYSLVDFTSAQGDGVAVTVDAQGYEATGDGSGSVLEGTNQIKHWLSNFVYGDYRTGNWLSDASVLNSTHFASAATFASNRGHKGARWIGGEPRVASEVLDEWCGSYQCRPFWTQLGKLAIRFEDHAIATTYFDDPWLRWERDDLGDWALRYDSLELLDRVSVQYLRNEAADQFTQSLEVRDQSLAHDAPESLEIPWAHGAIA